MAGVSGLRRFGWVAVLVGLAVLLILFTQLAAWNPWRYTHLMPYGRPMCVVAALTGAAGLLAEAVVRMLRGEVARRVGRSVGGVVALLVCVGGGCVGSVAWREHRDSRILRRSRQPVVVRDQAIHIRPEHPRGGQMDRIARA